MFEHPGIVVTGRDDRDVSFTVAAQGNDLVSALNARNRIQIKGRQQVAVWTGNLKQLTDQTKPAAAGK